MRKRLVGTAAAVMFAAFPQVALAQPQDDDTAAELADARLSRIDRLTVSRAGRGPAGEGGTPTRTPPFTFTLTAPFTYNSNVENAEDNRKDAFHATPSAVLDYRQQTGSAIFYARMGADIDEYTEHGENSGSTVFGRVGVRFDSPHLGGVKPYIQYAPVIIFGSGFDEEQLTLHNFTAGAGGETSLAGIPLSLDVNVTRREATSAEAERTQVTGSFEISGDLATDLSWAIGGVAQGRFYTGGTNDGREDLNLSATLGIAYRISDRFTLDLGLTVERNLSDRDGKDYTTLDAGPSLRLRVPFG